MNNPEKPATATQGTQDEEKKAKTKHNNMCWTRQYAIKHK